MVTNVLAYLEQSAARKPDAVAFSGPDERLTFSALKGRARAAGSGLAAILPPRRAVAVMMDKSCSAIVALMAALYAGGFYSFIDRSQPPDRIRAVLAKLEPGVILTEEQSRERVEALDAACPVLTLETLLQGEADEALLLAVRRNHIDTDPLYCNFTSGSSGVPKGVLVSHRSVIDFIEAFADVFPITGEDVLGNQAPLDFDVSVKDIYMGLRAGAEVVLIPRSYFTFLKKLLKLLEDRGVTTLIWAVSALCLISTMDGLAFLRPGRLKHILFSGEVMPEYPLRYWQSHYPDALFVNLYGPTEITCNCTCHIVDPRAPVGRGLPIGKPFGNERVFLLDEQNRQVSAPGVEGEICVGGTALALGYYNDPALTAQVFVQNPLQSAYPETIYRTGDLAKYGEDGLLYFVGRKDFQIKHHGRRVELGEIEAALTACGVRRACVLYMAAEERIVAYVMADQTPEELFTALRQRLPDYMIPAEILAADRLPMTPNGKLDRRALADGWHQQKAEQP